MGSINLSWLIVIGLFSVVSKTHWLSMSPQFVSSLTSLWNLSQDERFHPVRYLRFSFHGNYCPPYSSGKYMYMLASTWKLTPFVANLSNTFIFPHLILSILLPLKLWIFELAPRRPCLLLIYATLNRLCSKPMSACWITLLKWLVINKHSWDYILFCHIAV